MSPTFVRICQECGWALSECPTCSDLQCRCKAPWSGTVRQHYDKNGEPYQLAPYLRAAAQNETEGRREVKREAVVEMTAAGVPAADIAQALGVSKRTVFRKRAVQ